MPTPTRAALYLFFALLTLYAATGRYFIDNIDGETMYLQTRAIAQGRLWIVPEMTEKLNLWPGLGDHLYSVHSVFMSIAGLPLYYLGLAVTKIIPQLPEGLVLRAFWLLGPMLYTAATAAWLLLLLCRMGFTLRRSAAVAIIYGVATMAFPYARYSFSEPLSALLTIGATWFAWRVWEDEGPRREKWLPPVMCGLFLGLALLTRHANAVIVPLYLLFFLWIGWKQHHTTLTRLAPAVLASLAFALGLAAWMWYNYARFGDVFMTGSESHDFANLPKPNPFRAAAFLLFSPGKGLFLYCPIMIAATAGFWWLYKSLPEFTALLASVIVAHTLFYAAWPYFLGDWCWGPRFLVDLLPLWIIPLAAVPLTRRSKPVLATLLALSLAIQLLAVGIFYMRYFDRVVEEHGHVNWSYHSPERTPLLGAFQTARELRWYRLDLRQIISSASRPGEDLKTELRSTLDLWPVYAYRCGLPWPIWLLWLLQLSLAASLFQKLRRL